MAAGEGAITVQAGDQVVLHGVIVEAREGFALVAVAGSQPPGGYIAVAYDAMTVEYPVEPPA